MKKSILKKCRRLHSKKGFSLVELIVAIMILMITVGGCLSALNMSYRSVLMGAVKDDAQSLAQRDCDIIMSIISKQAENGTLDTHIVETSFINFDDAFFANAVVPDTSISAFSSSYDTAQYDDLKQHSGSVNSLTDFSTDKKSRFVKITKEVTKMIDPTSPSTAIECSVYKISVIVYYNTEKGAYVTCDGEVTVENAP